MIYNRTTRKFEFENNAKVSPSELIFRDLDLLLSPGEDICPELADFGNTLPIYDPNMPYKLPHIPDALPHQVEAIDWCVKSNGTGIVAYGMGLGKTFIAIASCGVLERKRILVVCPSHLKTNWAREITKWQPNASVHVCEGRKSEISKDALFTIINRDILADNEKRLGAFDQIVVDEVHKCGGWGTRAYKALTEVCKKARTTKGGILLLTGTLFTNSPMDAHTALSLLHPRIAGTRGAFETRFDPTGALKKEVLGLKRKRNTPRWLISKKWAEIKTKEKTGGRNGDMEGLRWLLSRHAISRKWEDVYPDDGKTRQTVFVSVDIALTERQFELLEKGIFMNDGHMDEDLATILRIVAEQKAPFVASYAEEWLLNNPDEKLVIATWHIAARDTIISALADFGVAHIAGTPKQKAKAEKAFEEDPDVRVCVINLESGGTGLNLVSASHLIFSEVPWTSASFEQVKARIDRIGQEAMDIRYTVFITSGTPEGAKFGTVKKKAGLNLQYLGA